MKEHKTTTSAGSFLFESICIIVQILLSLFIASWSFIYINKQSSGWNSVILFIGGILFVSFSVFGAYELYLGCKGMEIREKEKKQCIKK